MFLELFSLFAQFSKYGKFAHKIANCKLIFCNNVKLLSSKFQTAYLYKYGLQEACKYLQIHANPNASCAKQILKISFNFFGKMSLPQTVYFSIFKFLIQIDPVYCIVYTCRYKRRPRRCINCIINVLYNVYIYLLNNLFYYFTYYASHLSFLIIFFSNFLFFTNI